MRHEERRNDKKKRALKLWNAAKIRHSTQLGLGTRFWAFCTIIESADGQQLIKFILGSKAKQIEQSVALQARN